LWAATEGGGLQETILLCGWGEKKGEFPVKRGRVGRGAKHPKRVAKEKQKEKSNPDVFTRRTEKTESAKGHDPIVQGRKEKSVTLCWKPKMRGGGFSVWRQGIKTSGVKKHDQREGGEEAKSSVSVEKVVK